MTSVSNFARNALGVVVLATGAFALFAVLRPTSTPVSTSIFTSSEQCKECHAQAYSEWSVSWHAQAWSDPEVRALSNDFQNTDCIDCHASRPVFETGIGQRVLPRSARRGEGIDCIACHALPDAHISGGLMAGTRDVPSAACRPVALRDLGTPAFCATCHDQHKTVQQWKESEYATRGIGCVECHMPARGGDATKGHDHTMHGGHDLELVKRAVELRGKREGNHWIAEVENVGAGHNFPTDERSRAADVFWRPLGATTPWRHVYRFRSPYRHEVDLADTLLPAHAVKSIPIEDPDATGAIEVALFYKTKPYWIDPAHPDPEAEAKLVHKIELKP